VHSFRSKTHILGIFTPFRCSKMCVWIRTTKFRSKTHVLGGFTPFRCNTWPNVKISIGVHLMHEFMPPKPFLVLSQRTCRIHYFRSKTHVLGGSMPFSSRTWHVAKAGIEMHLMVCKPFQENGISIPVFAMCQVRLRNGVEPPKTWVLDWNSGLGMFIATK